MKLKFTALASICLLICTMACTKSNGKQVSNAYTPIIDTSLRWTIEKRFNKDAYRTVIFEYRIGKDSVFGSKVYQSVMSKNITAGDNTETVVAYLRETSDGKIYQIDVYDATEYLIYDFGVQQGDTDTIKNGCFEQKLTVASVENIVVNNSNRKKIVLNYKCFPPSSTRTWIEGIGSLLGLLNTNFEGFDCTDDGIDIISSGGTGSTLRSVHCNGQLVFENK